MTVFDRFAAAPSNRFSNFPPAIHDSKWARFCGNEPLAATAHNNGIVDDQPEAGVNGERTAAVAY